MRLVTYKDRDRKVKPGVLLDEEIVDISDRVANIGSVIEEGPDALGRLRNFLQKPLPRHFPAPGAAKTCRKWKSAKTTACRSST